MTKKKEIGNGYVPMTHGTSFLSFSKPLNWDATKKLSTVIVSILSSSYARCLMKKKGASNGGRKFTSRDVMIFMKAMEFRLSSKIGGLEKETAKVKIAVHNLDVSLNQRIDALEEDLVATVMDTIKIRQHVGLPVALEE